MKGKWFVFFLNGRIYYLSNPYLLLRVSVLTIGTFSLRVLAFLNSVFRCLFLLLVVWEADVSVSEAVNSTGRSYM